MVKSLCTKGGTPKFTCHITSGGKKSPNPLGHPNLLINCPIKLTYLINRQMGDSPIRPN